MDSSKIKNRIRLSRELRFNVVDDFESYIERAQNSWAGWPAKFEFVRLVSVRCTMEGFPNSNTGFLSDVKDIDRAIRESISEIAKSGEMPQLGLIDFLRKLFVEFRSQKTIGAMLEVVELAVTPYLQISISQKDLNMVSVTHQFEFSAAHRLHNPELSDEENKQLFGKCNNPNGHGHNYLVEVTIAHSVNGDSNSRNASIPLAEFQKIVKTNVIDRYDHKHLDMDLDDFRGTNSTVENIAMQIWNLLEPKFASEMRLRNIRVYETPKTWADFSK